MNKLLIGMLALVALAPFAAATPYSVCAPGNAACVTQADSPYGGPNCDSYLNAYGANADKNEVSVNAAGVTAAAGAQNMCANWFYNDGDYEGFYANAGAAGKTATFGWYVYDVDYHWPGAPADQHGEYIAVGTNAAGGNTGVTWIHRVTPSAGTNTCETIVYVNGAPTTTGCPAGGPPTPPAGNWGAVLP